MRFTIATYNIHKGFTQLNRRMVIHELREGLNSLEPDLVFLQEVQGLNERHALRFGSWPSAPSSAVSAASRASSSSDRRRRASSSWATRRRRGRR